MKLFYTKDFRNEVTVIVCIDGICVDRVYKAAGSKNSLAYDRESACKTDPNTGLANLLTKELQAGEAGHLYTHWKTNHNSKKIAYPLSSLHNRHVTATEFHPGDTTSIFFSDDMHFFYTQPDAINDIYFIMACDGFYQSQRVNLNERYDDSDERECSFLFADWEDFLDRKRDFAAFENDIFPAGNMLKVYPTAVEFDESHRIPKDLGRPKMIEKKVYYCQRVCDLYNFIDTIICINGICVDAELLDIDELAKMGKNVNTTLHDMLYDQLSNDSYYCDLWRESYDDKDQAYPESELPTHHQGAVLFDPTNPVHLTTPTEDPT